MGFDAQGNEFSYLMLIASHFVLNACSVAKQFSLFPFCDASNNQWTLKEQLRRVHIPDIAPSQMLDDICDLPRNNLLSMVAGDFGEIYSKQSAQWNVMISCFFLDTAHNVLDYLRIFSECLCVGGLLLNLGPLLFHFEDANGAPS